MSHSPDTDWTEAWALAPALALSTWTRRRDRLADPEAARLLALVLELTLLEARLRLEAWVILPGSLHLVARRPAGALLPWPAALGRIKGLHARCDNRRLGRTGSVWKPGARVRPLREGEVQHAALACELAPVAEGLCGEPGEWPFSSATGRR